MKTRLSTKKGILSFFKEYLIITLGIFLYVIGWTVFLLPNNLIGGGVSGAASMVQYATGGALKAGTTYFAVNVVLIICALFILGKSFGGKTIYATIIASIGLNLFQDIIPAQFIQDIAINNGKLMCVLMGGIIVGVGIGLSMSQGGSTGGTDIIALIINKYRNVSPGRVILYLDVVIIGSSLLVPSYTSSGEAIPFTEKVVTVVYGLLLVALNSYVLDMVLAGSKQSVQLMVLSKKYEQIADAISHDLHRGVTVLEGQGWYTKNEQKVLMVITRRTELTMFLKCIKSIDPDAFMSVASVNGVYGKGFDTFKTSKK